MSDKPTVVTLTPENAATYGCPCFMNPKHEGHLTKLRWLDNRFAEGLTIKLLYPASERKPVGFIEYVPGEFAWRAVDAEGWIFIHCIWVSPNKHKSKGYGSLLIREAIEDAKKEKKLGVAVLASEGSFMAGKDIFAANRFDIVDTAETPFLLMAKSLKKGPVPKLCDYRKQLGKYKGLCAVYSPQCPWVARSVHELSEVAQKAGVAMKFIELKTAKSAQNAPSLYGVFSLVYNGRLLADHYISSTRFRNILAKEMR